MNRAIGLVPVFLVVAFDAYDAAAVADAAAEVVAAAVEHDVEPPADWAALATPNILDHVRSL